MTYRIAFMCVCRVNIITYIFVSTPPRANREKYFNAVFNSKISKTSSVYNII